MQTTPTADEKYLVMSASGDFILGAPFTDKQDAEAAAAATPGLIVRPLSSVLAAAA